MSLPLMLSSLHLRPIHTAIVDQPPPEIPVATLRDSDLCKSDAKSTAIDAPIDVASAPSEFNDKNVATASDHTDQISFVLDRDELDSWSLV
jgi:hypothetical protein